MSWSSLYILSTPLSVKWLLVLRLMTRPFVKSKGLSSVVGMLTVCGVSNLMLLMLAALLPGVEWKVKVSVYLPFAIFFVFT